MPSVQGNLRHGLDGLARQVIRDSVYTTSIGTPIEPRNLLRHFRQTLDVLKIDRRHTAASLLLAQGATLHEVKEILGHSQIRLTADLYGLAYQAAKREVVSRVDEVLGPRWLPWPRKGDRTDV